MDNNLIQDVNIEEELDQITHTEAPELNTDFVEDPNHFEPVPDDNQDEPQSEEPQMTTAQYRTFAQNIMRSVDGIMCSAVDSRIYFKKYCESIPASALLECERMYNLQQDYAKGKKSAVVDVPTELENHYSQYVAYKRKMDAIKMTSEELKSTSEPLTAVLQQKLPVMSPTTSFVFAISMVIGSRAIQVIGDAR